MSGQEPHLSNDLRAVRAMGSEFERVASQQLPREAPRHRRWLRRRQRAVLLALAGALLATGVAGATTGIIDVGTVIQGGKPEGPPVNRLTVNETILATGTTPNGIHWRITSFKSEGTTDNGQVVEPAGLPCIRLVLSNPPAGTPLAGSGFCGEIKQDFNVAAVPIREEDGQVEVVLFGRAPAGSRGVELTTNSGKTLRADTYDGPSELRGDVWAMAADPSLRDSDPQVAYIGADGKPAGVRREASSQLGRGAALER